MASLSNEIRLFIVHRLACFGSPSEVAEAVAEQFGVQVDRRQVFQYDPRNPELGKRWREVFERTRKAFIADTTAIGISHQSYRLEQLGEIYRRALKAKNHPLALQVLETAAKESGGAFTSRRDLRIEDADEVLARVLGVPKEKLPI